MKDQINDTNRGSNIQRIIPIIHKHSLNFAMILLPFSIFIIIVLSVSCDSSDASLATDFSRMLGLLPETSVLNKNEIWFTDWNKVKKLNRMEDITTLAEFHSNSKEKVQLESDWSVYNDTPGPGWKKIPTTKYIGFDIMGIDRIIYTALPSGFSIVEADFNEKEIENLLTGLGYKKIEYGDYTFFGIRDDNKVDLESEYGRLSLMYFNRMGILDNRIIIGPSTSIVTGSFDVMSGRVPAVTDNIAARAVAENLNNVFCAVIVPSESLINKSRPYKFVIPAEWGKLHQYTMVGMGYRVEGGQSFIDIVIYYPEINEAREDGEEIVTRVKSYIFNTQFPVIKGGEVIRFTDLFEISAPLVKSYGEGTVLTLTCRLIPEGRKGLGPFMAGVEGPRDVLFLAPDPAKYVAP